eukprot:s823_g12.t1
METRVGVPDCVADFVAPDPDAAEGSRDLFASSDEKASRGGIVSYFTQEGGIANATRANHQAFATLAGVPYKQITWGHRRCGKMRAVAEALKCIPPGAWLFFIDADAAFRAQTEPCTARDPLLAQSTRSCRKHSVQSRGVCGWWDRPLLEAGPLASCSQQIGERSSGHVVRRDFNTP